MAVYLLLYGLTAAAFYLFIVRTAVAIPESPDVKTAPQRPGEVVELFPRQVQQKVA
ncbi:MAG TPA: hypothetical protein VG944_08565 [Fimbriimonas sp.]|nr:hypothetical protein [Fimbriimonas sp.]